jgi:glycosyltransferase involved in cell wall biosynthesis
LARKCAEIGEDEKTMTSFTIFTPSYNRARTLHRVYESLQHQTFRDFE